MCFPAKDHRLNMLHTLCVFSIISLTSGLFAQRWENLFGIAVDVATLMSTNKCCYLSVALMNGCSALILMLFTVFLACSLFMPDAQQRGIIKDVSTQLAAQGLKDTDSGGHVEGLMVLFQAFSGFITCAGAAYYAYQVYHYPGEVEDLKRGPGKDGKGHVVGQNCDEDEMEMLSN